jgi:hypothetical protein
MTGKRMAWTGAGATLIAGLVLAPVTGYLQELGARLRGSPTEAAAARYLGLVVEGFFRAVFWPLIVGGVVYWMSVRRMTAETEERTLPRVLEAVGIVGDQVEVQQHEIEALRADLEDAKQVLGYSQVKRRREADREREFQKTIAEAARMLTEVEMKKKSGG